MNNAKLNETFIELFWLLASGIYKNLSDKKL